MEIKKWHNETIAQNLVDVLNNKGYVGIYAKDSAEARQKVIDLIPNGASIGVGGSMTLAGLGLIDHFRDGDYKFIDRYNTSSWEETNDRYRDALTADYFVCSTNAVTRNGELVNVDCSGNRVAAMIFGPKKVIVVTGVNKVVENLEDAMTRLKKIAPMNCRRLNHKTPCYETAHCEDCQQQSRMCNYVTIINHGRKYEDRITVIVVPEELGF